MVSADDAVLVFVFVTQAQFGIGKLVAGHGLPEILMIRGLAGAGHCAGIVTTLKSATQQQTIGVVLCRQRPGLGIGALAIGQHGASFIGTVRSAKAEAAEIRAAVLHAVLHALLTTADDAIGAGKVGHAIFQRNQILDHLVSAVVVAQHHLAKAAIQANKGIAGSPVALAGAAIVDGDFLLNLPNGLQAIAQIFIAFETDLGGVAADAGGGFDVIGGIGRASGFDRFQRVIQGAVNGHVSQGQRGSTRCAQRNDKHFAVHGGTLQGKKRRGVASNTGQPRVYGA